MYKLSPSKAHRFLHCTKSLEFDTEFVDTPVTIRGKLLHTLAEKILKNEDSKEIYDFIDANQFNDYENNLVNAYVNAVYNEYSYINATTLKVENRRTISLYDNKINLVIDTLLLSIFIASVIDLKTGNGDVDAEDNEQLLFYAYSIALENPNIREFRLSIFQKCRLKTTTVSLKEVYDFFVEKQPIFEQISKNELTYNPHEKACKFCANKDKCTARAKWIINGKK